MNKLVIGTDISNSKDLSSLVAITKSYKKMTIVFQSVSESINKCFDAYKTFLNSEEGKRTIRKIRHEKRYHRMMERKSKK